MTDDIKNVVRTRLTSMGIPFMWFDHPPVSTMEECLALPWMQDDIMFCKNILLTNRQQTRYYYYVTCPDTSFRTAQVSKQLGVSRLSFAPGDTLPRLLHIHSGSLSPFSLWFDTERQVQLVLNKAIASKPRIAFHPCDHTATIVMDYGLFQQHLLPTLSENPLWINEEEHIRDGITGNI